MIISSEIPSSIYSKTKVLAQCDECGVQYERRYDGIVISFNKYGHHKCQLCAKKCGALINKGKKRPREVVEKFVRSHIESNKLRYPKFTFNCKHCNQEVTVPYRHRDRLYCGRVCQVRAMKRSNGSKNSICIVCKKEFEHYGERIVCGRECQAKYMSISRIGENNPAFKKDKEKVICLYCKKTFEYSRNGMESGACRVFCSLACAHKIDLKHRALSGHVNGYPFGWNVSLRNFIKTRDNFECQLCGAKESCPKHHIHHIDYDKHNLDYSNLITLCQKCHNMTHQGRTFWEIIFHGLISGSKIVKKEWGAEIHIANNNDYCLKYLIFFKGKQFSHHLHNLKKELWHCVYGKFECVLEIQKIKKHLIFVAGDKIEIEPTVIHQLQAIKNSILVEVSTRSFPEDSIRIIDGIN